jgi:hypothetical protein
MYVCIYSTGNKKGARFHGCRPSHDRRSDIHPRLIQLIFFQLCHALLSCSPGHLKSASELQVVFYQSVSMDTHPRQNDSGRLLDLPTLYRAFSDIAQFRIEICMRFIETERTAATVGRQVLAMVA